MEQNPSTPQQTDQQPPLQNPQPPPSTISSGVLPSSSSPSLPPPTITSSFPDPNPTPTSRPSTALQSQQPTPASQTRPAFNTRQWQQQPYSHFSLPSSPLPVSSASTSLSVPTPPLPRGGMAIGVPAQIPSAPPASFSSLIPPSYNQHSQIRQPMQGMGMTGTLGTTPSMRPSNQLRPSQSSLRPQPGSSNPSQTTQNFPGHGMLRVAAPSSSSSSSSPSSSQSQQSQTQPWMSSGPQGKPPVPTPSFRPQASTQSFQQRSHITQQNTPPATSQQQLVGSTQSSLQPSASGQPQEHFSPQFPASRVQQSTSHQQQTTRGGPPGSGIQRPSLGLTQSRPARADADESSIRIVTKRSIQELVNQIDPSEKINPAVEDILADIAEDFVESITTFGCSLAKHRKSTTLEEKDIILHLERNWNMTLPGFGGDEIKTYKKPTVSEIHRERLAAVKKSVLVSDMSKNSSGPSGGNIKSHLAKGPA